MRAICLAFLMLVKATLVSLHTMAAKAIRYNFFWLISNGWY